MLNFMFKNKRKLILIGKLNVDVGLMTFGVIFFIFNMPSLFRGLHIWAYVTDEPLFARNMCITHCEGQCSILLKYI